MASRRFLMNKSNHSSILTFFAALMLGSILISSCGTTEKAQKDTDTQNTVENNATDEKEDVSEEFAAILKSNRSNLNDVYGNLNKNIPQVFLRESETRDIGDPYEGYRIQIVSTRNVADADSIANDFRFWAEDTFLEYIPKAYVLFRQPYYKVHIGNFQFQNQATKLNQMLKFRYPDSWVVHDTVEPELVPTDTTFARRQ